VNGLRLPTSDGFDLEGRWDVSEHATRGAVVFCHPHPQQQGTMYAPLMVAVTRHLVDDGFAVLRFNYRGVGTSTGSWGHGHGELNDVAAAVMEARASFPDTAPGLAGWSFGAATSLRWLGSTGETLPWVGIAPPVAPTLTPELPAPGDLVNSRLTFIIGDRDQFTSVSALTAYADTVGGIVEVLPGSDHFFNFGEDRVAGLVTDGMTR
jgi:hypothetical protein